MDQIVIAQLKELEQVGDRVSYLDKAARTEFNFKVYETGLSFSNALLLYFV